MAKEALFFKTKEVAPMAMLGNGYTFQIALRKPPQRDQMGRMVIPMLIYPSRAIIEIYELLPSRRLNKLGGEAMWVDFPKMMVRDLNNPDLRAIQTVVYCGLEEESTEMTSAFDGLLEWDQDRDKMEDNLRAAASELLEENAALWRIDATKEKLLEEKRKAMGLRREREEDEDDKGKGSSSEIK